MAFSITGWPVWTTGAAPSPHVVPLLVVPPVLEPLTLDDAKLRAGLAWAPGDPRDALMLAFIAAARAKVERDTGLALLTQTRDVYLDAVAGSVIALPESARPLQSITSITTIDSAGVVHVLDPAQYIVDVASARIGLTGSGAWPTDLRAFQPWVIRVVAGFATVAALRAAEPLLIHAVGLLTAHYATLGRDLASADPVVEVPFGYSDAIQSYRPETGP